MKAISNSEVLASLIQRLTALRPDSSRRWGTLTAGEMLCHLADAAASVLDPSRSGSGRRRPLMKWIGLYAPIPWPHHVKAPSHVDPRQDGTRPGDFEQDRGRAVEGLRRLAAAPATAFAGSHSVFGAMAARDWHRWAYRHTDHHLRQFGL